MVLGPENGQQEAEEKHHQAKANQADDCKETHRHRDCHNNTFLVRSASQGPIRQTELYMELNCTHTVSA